jgi:hypothetical protein
VVSWMGYGLPFSLALVPHSYFIGRAAGAIELESPLAFTFLSGALAVTATALVLRDPTKVRRWLLAATGFALVLLPFVRLLAEGPGWLEALQTTRITVLALDLGVLFGGALCIRSALRAQRTSRDHRAVDAEEQSELTA